MNYNFFPRIVVRNPSYTFESYTEIPHCQILDDEFFRASLYFASVDFYNELKKKDFNYSKLSNLERNTLKKYWNRACFRPTPFGTFSSIATSFWSKEDHNIQLSDDLIVHLNLDYSSSLELADTLLANECSEFMTYTINPSIYKVFQNFRYFKYELKSPKNNRIFSVISLGRNKIINELIGFCKTGKTLNQIILFIEKKLESSGTQISSFVTQLIEEQIILPTKGSNITGGNCLVNLMDLLIARDVNSNEIDEVCDILSMISSTKILQSLDGIIGAGERLESLLNRVERKRNHFYAITERRTYNGGINEKYQDSILDGLYCLNKLSVHYESGALNSFKEKFIKKFESQKIQLLMALDPEVGIDYEDNLNICDNNWLLKDIDPGGDRNKHRTEFEWTSVHTYFLNKLVSHHQGSNVYTLEIHENELKKIDVAENCSELPPSLSVIFRLNGNFVYIESAGGVSAASIIGRFTSSNEEVFDLAKEIAQKEQEVNNSVLFAEIAYIGDLHLANINNRMHIRDYEIPVMVSSTLQVNHQIPLSDLYVSINSANQIILTSLSKNKIIIPRLSTAVNYTKSEFSAFRFLCDLQGQNLKSNFNLDISKLLPGLKFYPRVIYKSSIICLATWHLKSADFFECKQKEESDWFVYFSLLAKNLNLPTYFTLNFHDNYLVFERKSKSDIELFLQTIEKYEDICIQEFLFDNTSMVENESGEKPLVAQYISSLFRENVTYKFDPERINVFESTIAKKSNKPQKADWLYFKIYCHPVSSNELLLTIILPLVNKLIRKKLISKWFFIRYRDDDYHLRFRVEVSKATLNETRWLIYKYLDKGVGRSLIEKYFTDIYLQELERYPVAIVDHVENVFFASSHLVLDYLKRYGSANVEFLFTPLVDFIFSSIEDFLSAFGIKMSERVSLMDELFKGFYLEVRGDRNLKKELEKKYKEIQYHLNAYNKSDAGLNKLFLKRRSFFCRALKDLNNRCEGLNDSQVKKLISDLIHMHLNRLFIDNARKYELVVYYIFYRHFSSIHFKSNHNPD